MRHYILLSMWIAAVVFGASACRDKTDGGTGPNPPPDEHPWRLYTYKVGGVLRAGARDTISVRLYNDANVLQNGRVVFSRSINDPNRVTTSVVTSTDTVRNPYGTTEILPMTYWGQGGPDLTETIESWVILNGDTMAFTSSRFKIQP